MKRSISIRDAANCIQLVEECGELWSDAHAWQEHLATGFGKLIGEAMAVYLRSQLTPAAPSIHEIGIARDTDSALRRMLAAYLQSGGFRFLPELEIITPIALRDRVLAYQQVELVSRDSYYRSLLYQQFMKPHRLENVLSTARLDTAGRVFGFFLFIAHEARVASLRETLPPPACSISSSRSE